MKSNVDCNFVHCVRCAAGPNAQPPTWCVGFRGPPFADGDEVNAALVVVKLPGGDEGLGAAMGSAPAQTMIASEDAEAGQGLEMGD